MRWALAARLIGLAAAVAAAASGGVAAQGGAAAPAPAASQNATFVVCVASAPPLADCKLNSSLSGFSGAGWGRTEG